MIALNSDSESLPTPFS